MYLLIYFQLLLSLLKKECIKFSFIKNIRVHRDLKPENILMDKGVCKIADFGFAVAITNMHKTKLDISLGSPLYMGIFSFIKK